MSDETKTENENKETKPLEFDSWIKGQPEAVRTMISGRIEPIKHDAKMAHRTIKAHEEIITGLRANENPDMKKEYDQLQSSLADIKAENQFFKNAPRDLIDPAAAFTLAKAGGFISSNGGFDADGFKKGYEYMFKEVVTERHSPIRKTTTNAAAGNESQVGSMSISDNIRRAAGK